MTCLLCGTGEKKLNTRGFCSKCYSALEEKAYRIQSREEAHGWLHTRADRYGRPYSDDAHERNMILRRVDQARRSHIEWWEKPHRRTYPTILDEVAKRAGGQASRRGKAAAKARTSKQGGAMLPLAPSRPLLANTNAK